MNAAALALAGSLVLIEGLIIGVSALLGLFSKVAR